MLKKLLYSGKPVPVILDSGTNGLGVVRSLGHAGLSSIMIDCRKRDGFYSKYSNGLISPDPLINEQDFITYLMDLGSKLQARGFIIAASDKFLIPICRHRKELEKFYLFPMPGWDVIENCIDKSKLYKIAEDVNIKYPMTIRINSINELRNEYKSLKLPFIVKPNINVKYLDRLQSDKVIVIKEIKDIEHWINRIHDLRLDDVPLVLQEMIPGEVNNLFTLTSYSNKKGKIIAYSTGYKIRQHPPDAGVITAGKVVHEPEIYGLGERLISALGFYGISNIEFKKDNRDGVFKLIEINPRPGKWNYSTYAAGINLPLLAYREVMGEEFDFIGSTDKEIIWLVIIEDLYNSIYGNRNKGYNEFNLTLLEWYASLRGKKVDGVISLRDWKPGLMALYKFIRRIFRHFFKRKRYKVINN